jgi:hypothetical protein
MYKLQKDLDGVVRSVINVQSGGHVPFNPANTDYQAYLAWLAEGNEPLPADEETQ